MFVEFFGEIFKLILNFVQTFGYTGIFIMTFIESTFIPIPSEFTLIPAGILIAKGELHLAPVLIFGLTGTLLGSFVNYFIAYYFGRKLFINYGKYFFLKPGQLLSLELFFNNIKLPEKEINLNQCSTISNPNKFITSHLATVKANSGNLIYLPYLERLQGLRLLLKE